MGRHKISPRELARQAGKKYYRIDRPCRNGHLTLRLTQNGNCVQCQRDREKSIVRTIKNKKNILAQAHGLDQEQIELMLKNQNGKCPCCNLVFGIDRSNYFVVDHDHSTGAVRGLLCSPCNLVIGNAKDNPDILQAMISYLKK